MVQKYFYKATEEGMRSGYDPNFQHRMGYNVHSNPDLSPVVCGQGCHLAKTLSDAYGYVPSATEFYLATAGRILGQDETKVRVGEWNIIFRIPKSIVDDYYAKRKSLNDDYYAKCKSCYGDYHAKWKPLYNDYHAKRKSLDDDYYAERKPFDDDYYAKRKPLDDDYHAKRKLLYGDYHAKWKPLYNDYHAKRKSLNKAILRRIKEVMLSVKEGKRRVS